MTGRDPSAVAAAAETFGGGEPIRTLTEETTR
jgi:hypothetical protein